MSLKSFPLARSPSSSRVAVIPLRTHLPTFLPEAHAAGSNGARAPPSHEHTVKPFEVRYSKFNDGHPRESDAFRAEGSGQVSPERTLTNICRWQTFTLRQSET